MRYVVLLGLLVAAAAPQAAVAGPAAHSRTTVILLHAGGWSATGPWATATIRPAARRFRRLGYRVVNLDYAAGPAGLADLERVYDAERRRGRSVCLYGESAGGSWALTLARERDVACVIAAAAPIDLLDPQAAEVNAVAARLLGADMLGAYDPLSHAAEIRAPVLLVYARVDPFIRLDQGFRMRDALGSDGRLVVVEPGAKPWIHTTVSPASLAAAERAQARWLRRVEL